MKRIIFLIITLQTSLIFCQENLNNLYPTNYFVKPLEIPLYLSGTFGEFRTNHFHSGLDIKTNQIEGLSVYAAANGYVSRIRISPWGFGKAIYIVHPNGFTTVYGHLKKFNSKIEAYAKKAQYDQQSFEVELFPKDGELPIFKNEIIAYSGSTGGFVGPHLHFEIRDTSTEKTINPQFFGIDITDTVKPVITNIYGYPLSENSTINQLNTPVQLLFRKQKDGDLLANSIYAFGNIGFGINTFDTANNSDNKNGIYRLKMTVNGLDYYTFEADTFSFSETNLINFAIDYKKYQQTNQRIIKCYNQPTTNLSLIKPNLLNGILDVKDGFTYTVVISVSDFKGNLQRVTIPIIGKNKPAKLKTEIKKTPYHIEFNKSNIFSNNGVTVLFAPNTFLENFDLDFSVQDSLVKVHAPTIPLTQPYRLEFDVSNYTTNQLQHLYIANLDINKRSSYQNTLINDNTLYTITKNLGYFKLLKDNTLPKIKLKNFKNNQWVTYKNTLEIEISDTGSGIDSYNGEIDGEWILLEYNVKKGVLIFDLNDKNFKNSKHTLKIVVTDKVGNKNSLTTTFFKKYSF